jgi:predicted HTH domain antitoxin
VYVLEGARKPGFENSFESPKEAQSLLLVPTRDAADDTLATAIGQYVLGEVSLGKAAENAGMTRWEFEELLEDAGFDALYGPRSTEELRDEVDAALDLE